MRSHIVAAALLQAAFAAKTSYNFMSQGQNIAADLYLPNRTSSGKLPVAVAGPGFPAIKDMFFPAYGEALANAGIGLLVFDYPGFGSSGGKTRQDVVVDQQHTVYTDALNMVSKDSRFDASRMGVFGKSLSGAHSLFMAATDNRVRAAVAIIPHIKSDASAVIQHIPFLTEIAEDETARLTDGARTYVPAYGPPGSHAIMNSDGAQQYLSVKSKGTTYKNEATASSILAIGSYDVSERAQTIKIPVVAIAAKSDTITPAANIHAALDGVRSAKVYDFPGQHFTVTDPNEARLVDITVKHFQQNL